MRYLLCTKVSFPIFNSVSLWSARVSKLSSIDCSMGTEWQSEWRSLLSLLHFLYLVGGSSYFISFRYTILILCFDVSWYMVIYYTIKISWHSAIFFCGPLLKLRGNVFSNIYTLYICFWMPVSSNSWFCIWWWTQTSWKAKLTVLKITRSMQKDLLTGRSASYFKLCLCQ